MSDLVLAVTAVAEAGVRKCEPFSLSTDCPRCGVVDLHYALVQVDEFIPRSCIECGFEWKQFA